MQVDIGLLVLRIGAAGTVLLVHGYAKLMNFSVLKDSFPDPIGLGPSLSLGLAVFAEVVCSAAVLVGFKTRIAAIPLLSTMAVAAVIVHAQDPWSSKELAVVYGLIFAALAFTGGGKYSLDEKI